ncbi:hypothetical protein K469DRAFT_683947 [Zopfia rhizophila CBS 207.26]|uniref:Uncharacterized protein n=1 Tax=Zopfia rhizophila CBS 207.26 TaxID=1314779 RepID=A0A6A6DB65_9PEZI|nr:hypothetical protein K469DRAFT_683947 [Zopfia rhizophila CBS 207.26]
MIFSFNIQNYSSSELSFRSSDTDEGEAAPHTHNDSWGKLKLPPIDPTENLLPIEATEEFVEDALDAFSSEDDLSSVGAAEEWPLCDQQEHDSQSPPPMKEVPKANQVLPRFPARKAIAVTNWPKWNVRAYFQDSFGYIREVCQTDKNGGGWHITPEYIGIEDAKSGTPLAVISRGEGSEIRVFYVSTGDIIHERRCFKGRGWFNGKLNEKRILVSPGSQLASVVLGQVIKIYYQARNGAIRECSYMDTESTWKDQITPVTALSGSALAAITYPGKEDLVVHIYYQAGDLTVRDLVWEESSWKAGEFPPSQAQRYTTLAAISWEFDSKQIAVYWQSDSGALQELRSEDDEWDEYSEDCHIPVPLAGGEQLAVMRQKVGLGDVLRAYFVTSDDQIGEISCNPMTMKWASEIKKRPV